VAGNRVIEVILRAKDLTAGAFQGFQKNLQGAVRLSKSVARDLAGVAAAAVATTVAFQRLGERGAAVLGVKASFAKLTGDETAALQRLRVAAAGTVTDFDLMSRHNQALALGAARTTEEFARMVEIAKALGRAQGIDAQLAVESLTTGIGRQSKLFLDNLGILIDVEKTNQRYAAALGVTSDALTDAQKKEAFRAEALKQGEELVSRISASQNTAADAAARFSVTIQNVRDRLSELVATSPAVNAYFEGMAFWLEELSGQNVSLPGIEESVGNIASLDVAQDRFRKASEEAAGLRDEVARLEASIKSMGASGREVGATSIWIDAERLRAAREELEFVSAEAEVLGRRIVSLSAPAASAAPEGGAGSGGGGRAPSALTGTQTELRGLLDAIQKTRKELDEATLAEKLAQPGEAAEKAKEKVDELAASLARLNSIAAPFGGALASLAIGPIPDVNPGILKRQTAREAERERMGLQPVGWRDPITGLRKGQGLGPSARGATGLANVANDAAAREEQWNSAGKALEDAGEQMQRAKAVAASAMLGTVEAVVRGSGQIRESVVGMIGSILQAAVKNPLHGALIGGVVGIIGGLFNRSRRDPMPVRVEDYSSQAERKMKDAPKRPIQQKIIIETGGQEVGRIESELFDRQERDEVVRFRPSGRRLS